MMSLTSSMSSLRISATAASRVSTVQQQAARATCHLSCRRHVVAMPQRVVATPVTVQEEQPRSGAAVVVCGKLKTRKAAAKRFKISGNGKVLSRRPGKQHINEKKSSKRLSQLSREKRIPNSELDNVIGCLPYAGIQKQLKASLCMSNGLRISWSDAHERDRVPTAFILHVEGS